MQKGLFPQVQQSGRRPGAAGAATPLHRPLREHLVIGVQQVRRGMVPDQPLQPRTRAIRALGIALLLIGLNAAARALQNGHLAWETRLDGTAERWAGAKHPRPFL